MADTGLTQSDPAEIVARLEDATGTLERALSDRWAALRSIGDEWTNLRAVVEAKGLSLPSLALMAAGTAIATYLLIVGFRALLHSRTGKAGSWKRGAVILGSTFLAVLVMAIATRLAVSDLDLRRVLRTWVFTIGLFYLLRSALLALFPKNAPEMAATPNAAPEPPTSRFRDIVTLAILWAFVGIAISTTLRVYQGGPGPAGFHRHRDHHRSRDVSPGLCVLAAPRPRSKADRACGDEFAIAPPPRARAGRGSRFRCLS